MHSLEVANSTIATVGGVRRVDVYKQLAPVQTTKQGHNV